MICIDFVGKKWHESESYWLISWRQISDGSMFGAFGPSRSHLQGYPEDQHCSRPVTWQLSYQWQLSYYAIVCTVLLAWWLPPLSVHTILHDRIIWIDMAQSRFGSSMRIATTMQAKQPCFATSWHIFCTLPILSSSPWFYDHYDHYIHLFTNWIEQHSRNWDPQNTQCLQRASTETLNFNVHCGGTGYSRPWMCRWVFSCLPWMCFFPHCTRWKNPTIDDRYIKMIVELS